MAAGIDVSMSAPTGADVDHAGRLRYLESASQAADNFRADAGPSVSESAHEGYVLSRKPLANAVTRWNEVALSPLARMTNGVYVVQINCQPIDKLFCRSRSQRLSARLRGYTESTVLPTSPTFFYAERFQVASCVTTDLVNQAMDDPLLYFRPESQATVVELGDDGDRVSSDTADQKCILGSQADFGKLNNRAD